MPVLAEERADLAEVLADGHVVVKADCRNCGGNGVVAVEPDESLEPPEEQDCSPCDGTGRVDELVPVMDFVRFVLDHVPEREPHPDTQLGSVADQHRATLKKLMSQALDRSQRANASETTRQRALETYAHAAAALREIEP